MAEQVHNPQTLRSMRGGDVTKEIVRIPKPLQASDSRQEIAVRALDGRIDFAKQTIALTGDVRAAAGFATWNIPQQRMAAQGDCATGKTATTERS